MHRRKLIRDAAVALLTGLPLTGSRVYPFRTTAIPPANLPAIRIYTPSEAWPGGDTMNDDVLVRIALRVEVVCKALDDVEDQVDAVCEQIEAAVDASDRTLGGACAWLRMESTEIDYEDDDQTVMQATLDYEVTYTKE